MLPIRTIPANPANYGGVRAGRPQYLVLHYTANDGDSGRSNGRYFQNALSPAASAHFFVDDEGVTASVPEDMVAWHCGAYRYFHPRCRNRNSLGIELCDQNRDGRVLAGEKTIRNAVLLAAALCKKYDIPPKNILRHYDVTHKRCPAYWVDDPAGFEAFKRRVEEELEMVEKTVIVVDGREWPVRRILKNGVNYLRARDLAAAFGCRISARGSTAVFQTEKEENAHGAEPEG
jgi:N-acetylmuramoyl-L-alanine amidase CwlA